LESNNFRHLSSEEPTYWPTDRNKLPDLVEFCVTKGIRCNFAAAKSCFELFSDHSPVLVTLSIQAILRVPQLRLCNRKTDWDAFRHLLNERLLLNVLLKTVFDIEAAIKNISDIIQWAVWTITPDHTEARQTYDCPILIKQKTLEQKETPHKLASLSHTKE
jgi:hypothetical protein